LDRQISDQLTLELQLLERELALGFKFFKISGNTFGFNSPLRRTVTIEEVGETAAFLLSPMGRGITGEILHVDAGYHVVGMKNPAAPDISVVGKD
jgi:enoyl-[acyl-carrier-protein] reductase (NADH)